MADQAQFYVKDSDGNLVPARFLIGLDGTPVVNPNSTPNTYNSLNNKYFSANGAEITNANADNYLVVPVNYNIADAISYGKYVREVAYSDMPHGSAVGAMVGMIPAFKGSGSQNLQRTYVGADGNPVVAGTHVPMFQDAASFHLGVVSELAGFKDFAVVGGGVYNLFFGGDDTSGSFWNNPRNVDSISGGSSYIRNNVDLVNNAGGAATYTPSTESQGYVVTAGQL